MGSKSSKTNHPTSQVPVGPRLPQEIVDEILDLLVADSDSSSLLSCSLASKYWVQRCRIYLFHTILFTSELTTRWVEAFPVHEQSPAHLVRDLRFVAGPHFDAPNAFLEYIPWFSNVERLTLLGFGRWETLCQMLSLGTFPQSVTSLTVNAGMTIDALQIHNILAQLPNLNDISLSGSLSAMNRNKLSGIGAALTGSFRGRLRLLERHADADVMNMLLEVPTGLHFTQVEVLGVHDCLISTVRLVEACERTLVKLTYSVDVDVYYDQETPEKSFDFSKFPNLQQVRLGFRWIQGRPRWVPDSLSTINPFTSPHLSVLHLNLVGLPGRHASSARVLGNDLRRTADEVARIRREFGEGIELVVFRDQWFRGILNSLELRL